MLHLLLILNTTTAWYKDINHQILSIIYFYLASYILVISDLFPNDHIDNMHAMAPSFYNNYKLPSPYSLGFSPWPSLPHPSIYVTTLLPYTLLLWNPADFNHSWLCNDFKEWWTNACNFSKAFDTGPHNKMCYKLFSYAICGQLLNYTIIFLISAQYQILIIIKKFSMYELEN